jgi:adenylate cyclase
MRLSYERRLLATFVGVALLTTAVSTALLFTLAHRYISQEFRSKVLSIATTAAALINGDPQTHIRTRADEASPEYATLREELRRVRDANRRDDTYVKFVYTMVPRPDRPGTFQFGVDPEEDKDSQSHVADFVRSTNASSWRVDQAQVDKTLQSDEYGTWLSATAPLRASGGTPVGLVRIDVPATEVSRMERPIILGALASVLLAAGIAFGSAVIVARRASRPMIALTRTVEAIGGGALATRVTIDTEDEFGALGRAVNRMAEGLQERNRVKNAFARYVSHQVLDSVLATDELPQLSGQRCNVTVMFCDIRGFTRFAEQMAPEKVVEFLNEYFEAMVDVVFKHHGTLDKFIGDALMVLFGVPTSDPYQEEHAITAAIEMRDVAGRLREKWHAEGKKSFTVGFGINSGPAIVGNIGSPQRMEYTAIGDTVNLASRLESATRAQGVDILISEYTYNAIRGRFATVRVGEIEIRGHDPVLTYTIASTEATPAS